MAIVFLSLILFLPQKTWSHLTTHFFKTLESTLPSGQASVTELEKKLISKESYSFAHIIKDNQPLIVRGEDIFLDLDLSFFVIDQKTQSKKELLKRVGNTYLIKNKDGKISNRLINEISPWPGDKGKIITWKETSFIRELDKKTIRIKPLQEFKIIECIHDYALVKQLFYPYEIGYLALQDGISKFDLTEQALSKNKWVPVNHKQNGYLISNTKKIPLSRVDGLLTTPQKIIYLGENYKNVLVPRSQAYLKKMHLEQWNQSHHTDYGFVWWQYPPPMEVFESESWTLEEIKARNIFSVASHPLYPETLLVSAGGLFFSDDGLNFKKIKKFENQNWPVAISKEGSLYVGYHKGHLKNFEFYPYFKPQSLTQFFKHSQSQLKIQELLIFDTWIRLTISNGYRHVQLKATRTNSFIDSWQYW